MKPWSKPKSNLWPYGVITAFVLFFAGMAAAVIITTTHREQLVSENYYENELNFQNQMESINRAEQAGAEIHYFFNAQCLVIDVPVEQLAKNLAGKVELYRADAPALDRKLPLAPLKDGTQTVNLSAFAPGPWLVKVAWQAGGKDYYLEKKIVVPAS